MCLSASKMNRNYDSVDILGARPINKESQLYDEEVKEKVFISDILASVTQQTRKSFQLIVAATEALKKSVYYKTLTRTTQPAHVASIILVLIISVCLWPELNHEHHDGQHKSLLTKFIYLGTFASHFGAQVWMTFVSGLALYFSLPRHTFGLCQEILFPKYFLMNTLLSSATLVTFAKINTNLSDRRWLIQLATLSICVIIEMTIYLYLTPTLLKAMKAKYYFEQKTGTGQEIGYQQETKATVNCTMYLQINKNFRKVHMQVTIGNIIAICCSFLHLYYLASKVTLNL